MFDALRLVVLSFLYYFGFIYASFTALKQRTTTVVTAERPVVSPTSGNVTHPRNTILIGVPALKLMIMLTSMALLSLVGAEWVPLFLEMRVIFMYTLLFAPPFTQQELYDQLFGPLLVRGGTFVLSLQRSDFFSRRVSLFVVRCCVNGSIAAMNYTQRSHSLDEDAVRDILSGLRFSQRALQQVADMTRESEGATYAQIARESSFPVGIVTSHVRRAREAKNWRDNLRDRPPLVGRVVENQHMDPSSAWPIAAASLSSTSMFSNTRSDELLESLHSEYAHTLSNCRDAG
ncbi:hypothetical protein JKF63_01416 [Porcisia hertigi]|uniref:Uncharacterized protein n=1 Tax=Porcisia hertigi TaxID=2761500 RepID=A0A836I998_9TRYP|nr:hypothetical protein JKF63_01416 [Porcisia hertigi]